MQLATGRTSGLTSSEGEDFISGTTCLSSPVQDSSSSHILCDEKEHRNQVSILTVTDRPTQCCEGNITSASLFVRVRVYVCVCASDAKAATPGIRVSMLWEGKGRVREVASGSPAEGDFFGHRGGAGRV